MAPTLACRPPRPRTQYADSGSDDGGSGSDSEEESAGRKRKTRRVQVVKGRKRIRRTPSTASAAAHDWRAAAHAAPAHVVSLTEDNAVTVDDDDDDGVLCRHGVRCRMALLLIVPMRHAHRFAHAAGPCARVRVKQPASARCFGGGQVSSLPTLRCTCITLRVIRLPALTALRRKALTATATLRRQLYQSRNMQESLLSGIEQQQAALSAAPTGAGDDAATAATVSAILSSVSALQDADAHHEGGAESPQEDADATLMLKLRVAGSDTTSVVRMGMVRAGSCALLCNSLLTLLCAADPRVWGAEREARGVARSARVCCADHCGW